SPDCRIRPTAPEEDHVAQARSAIRPVKVRHLAEGLGGQSQVASALRVDRAQVTRWLRGARPDRANEARIDALEFVVARLRQMLSPGTAVKWLTGVNAHLGNRRPIDLLADERVAEVIAAIEQERNDSYA